MTREEAIAYWKKARKDTAGEKREAINMAISALTEAENGCDGCLYEVSDGSLFPCNICRLNYGCKYEKDDSNYITESPNEVVKTDDEVIDHDKEWIIGCIKHDGFINTDRFDKANQIILDALTNGIPSSKYVINEQTEPSEALEVQKCHIKTEPNKIKRHQLEVGAVADGIVGYETIKKTAEKYYEKQTEPTDLISRADAMGEVQDHFNADGFKGYDDGQKMMDRIKDLPSVSATNDENVQNCGDLISRADAIKAINDLHGGCITDNVKDITEYVLLGVPSVSTAELLAELGVATFDELMEEPSAERVGEWIKGEDILDNTFIISCSVCGEGMYAHYNDEKYPNCCPNCGAVLTAMREWGWSE